MSLGNVMFYVIILSYRHALLSYPQVHMSLCPQMSATPETGHGEGSGGSSAGSSSHLCSSVEEGRGAVKATPGNSDLGSK